MDQQQQSELLGSYGYIVHQLIRTVEQLEQQGQPVPRELRSLAEVANDLPEMEIRA